MIRMDGSQTTTILEDVIIAYQGTGAGMTGTGA
jgi:hypothetical protein